MREGSSEPQKKKQKVLSDILESNRCLDRLGRLMEMTSQGCTAVCFVNNKILISDNDIDAGTHFEEFGQQEGNKIQLIKNVMEYFALLAQEEIPDNREEIFADICLKRIKGEETKYIKLVDTEIKEIVLDVLNHRNSWREGYKPRIKSYSIEKRKYAAAAYEISTTLARDFVRIERFISENPEHNLTKAFAAGYLGPVVTDEYDAISYKDYNLMQDELIDMFGYIILAIGKVPGKDKEHAEGKITDYLLFTEVIQNAEQPIYIGISKLCCNGCALALNAVNEYKNNLRIMHDGKELDMQQHIDYLQKREDHHLVFSWAKTIFLYDDEGKIKGEAQHNYVI